MSYVCTSLAIVFSYLSPMVNERLSRLEANFELESKHEDLLEIKKLKKELRFLNSTHYLPLKWALKVVDEANKKKTMNESYLNTLVNEINDIHKQCDRLVCLKHKLFSKELTFFAYLSIFSFLVVGTVNFELTLS